MHVLTARRPCLDATGVSKLTIHVAFDGTACAIERQVT
jgi:hypothetical protein